MWHGARCNKVFHHVFLYRERADIDELQFYFDFPRCRHFLSHRQAPRGYVVDKDKFMITAPIKMWILIFFFCMFAFRDIDWKWNPIVFYFCHNTALKLVVVTTKPKMGFLFRWPHNPFSQFLRRKCQCEVLSSTENKNCMLRAWFMIIDHRR